MKLTKEQILRYKKQISLTEIGIEGQLNIKKSKVLVIGAGGLGSPILLYLTAAGIGTIACMDHDRVEIHNLHRQIAHREHNIAVPKVYSAQSMLQQINSEIIYIPIHEKADKDSLSGIIEQYDIVIDGSDNFETRYCINDVCVAYGKPLVYGSVLNFELQLSIFNHQGSKNLRDLFPSAPAAEDVPNCDLNGVINTAPGILGLMMTQETLKLILKLPILTNQLLIIDTLNWKFKKIMF